MFDGATSFNHSYAGWVIGNVTHMANMFRGATSFNQSLASWDTSNVTVDDDESAVVEK
jgi:surface protein